MFGHLSGDDERRLADRLKREARASRPEFSRDLHARLCQAVRDDETRVVRGQREFGRSRRFWSFAIAATLLVSASAFVLWLTVSSGPAPEVARVIDEHTDADVDLVVDATSLPVQHIGTLVDSMLTTQQWAYLDHDIRVASRLLVEQLPVDLSSLE